MELLTRQQAEQTWFEPDPKAQFDDLLEALGLYKDISTEYGLNQTVHHQWRFGDPHKKSGEPDRHDYEIKVVNGVEVAPGPNWHSLYRWVVSQAAEFLAFQTVYLITDNRDLLADTVASTPGLSHWPMVAAWWKERIRYVGPYGEHTTVVFVPISADTGLDKVHPTWAGTYILDACVFLFPSINFVLIDSDCVPVTLFEVQELWLSCAGHDSPAEGCLQPELMPSSPIAPAHKRARSVDTGKATQQQPGPPIKLSKSRSVENFAAIDVRAPPPDDTGNFEDEVDFGGSEPPSPHPTEREEEKSGNSSPTAHSCSGSTDKRVTLRALQPAASKGVILVSEAFTEINAGLVIVLASGHRSPLLETELADPERDPDELATIASKAYLDHVEGYLSTTQPPCDTETAVSSGLLGSPLLGTTTRCAADWCHAWSLLGQWSGWVTFWQAEIKGEVFDLVQCAQRIYTGAAARTSQILIDRPQKWAQWIFSVGNVWQEDSPMPDRPLTVHCSGLGGGLLSPEHEYDIFFQNHAQMKVYGPSLAMTDDWEQRVTQLGLTKTTHEYAIYQLFSTALGWSAWKAFLPDRFANHKLLITRAIRLLTAATIRPAHARPPHPTWVTAVRQIFRCYHPQGKLFFLRACFPQYVTVPVPDGIRDVDVLGFSAGSYTGLAIHEVLNEFDCFPGTTKVAAIASPPEMLRLATGERRVVLLHCLEDRLCVWRPDTLTDLSYNIVLIDGHPSWSGRARHAYGHLLFTPIEEGTYHIDYLQITTPEVIPHGIRCEGLLRVLSWVSFDLPDHCKRTLSALLQAAGDGCSDLHTVPCDGRDVRDDPLATEQDLRQVLIDMIPIPGQAHAEGGHLMRDLLAEFLRGFSLRTLIFLLDMVLPQLDAYHAGRQLQHLQPWISVELAQQQARGQQGVELAVKYVYEAYAGFHVIQLLTEGAPILLFSDPNAVPHVSPWNLCATGNLGSMESNVMAGRALFGRFQLPDGLRRCAIFLVQEKVMHGTSRAADDRAYRRIAPKSLELVVVSRPVAFAFCGRLLVQQPAGVDYFDPARDWPQPIEFHATFSILLEELAFLGDTRSRCELLVFAQANPARLPLTVGILQPDIPVRRMTSERRTKLTDALVRVLRRFLTPIGVALPGAHDGYMRDSLLALAGHGDGHVLTVAVALLLAILTGRSDLCIAGVFGAGKTRSLAVLLIALSCELDDFYAVVYTKENVAAKALADQISDLSPPTQSTFGRLLGRIEEGKGEAYATKIDVRCSDRNRVIAEKRILIATGGSATAEMAMKYSSFSLWLSRAWLAFMDESQQYGNYHEIAALAAIQQPALIVFVGDHRQTPGGLSKGRAAAANRQKLLHRPLGLRALNRPGDYLPPARLTKLIALLWPDASQDNDSDVACLLNVGQAPHTGVWTAATTTQHLPTSLARLFSEETLSHLNVASCLISAILAVLLIATAPEEFGIPECTTTVEAAGLDGPHRWGIILPNSSRVSADVQSHRSC